MLSFGKSSSGRKGLVRRHKFDTLVQVGPRMSEGSYSFNDLTCARMLTVSTAPKQPGRGNSIEVHLIKRDESDLAVEDDDVLEYTPFRRHTLRENRGWSARMNMQRKITELQERFWGMDRAAAEQRIKDEQRDKPKCDLRGHMFLELNLDGEEKLERCEAQEHRRKHRTNGSYERPGKSWKSCGEKNVWIYIPTSDLETAKGDTKRVKIGGTRFKANKQWATKKPKFHCAWTIGEETSATYLLWKREDDQTDRDYEEMVAAEMDRENELELSAARWEAAYDLELSERWKLESRYRYGRWNHNEIDPETEVMGWDDELWFMDEAA